MNQSQREFLINKIEETCDIQIKELKSIIPEKPSLNNYLIAAFLDDSIKFADIEALKQKMRKAILKLGPSDQLIETVGRYHDEREIVAVNPEDLFVIPAAYLVAIEEYQSVKNVLEQKIKALINTKNTIVLKLQIGSSAVLDKLVSQVDNMGDLSLINTQLLLENKNDR